MDFLSREGSPLPEALWEKIDETVVSAAKKALVGRRFLSLYGPLGAGMQSINVDDFAALGETEGSPVKTLGRQYVELPVLYKDFFMLWRDIENSEKLGLPIDLSAAMNAAVQAARQEDELVFSGLLSVKGAKKVKKGDWSTGETPVTDVCQGLTYFTEAGIIGKAALIVSPDLYLQLQRIQPGTGITEYERVKELVKLYQTPVLGKNKAVLVNPQPQYMDLAVGQDLATAYLETKDLNHYLRILETVLPRIKNKDAIVIYE